MKKSYIGNLLNTHYDGQLPKYMFISLLIDDFMLITHSTDYFFSHDWYPMYRISLQVIYKTCTTLQVIVEIGYDFAEDR